MKNGKLIMDSYYAKFEGQLEENARLNAPIAGNLGRMKVNG